MRLAVLHNGSCGCSVRGCGLGPVSACQTRTSCTLARSGVLLEKQLLGTPLSLRRLRDGFLAVRAVSGGKTKKHMLPADLAVPLKCAGGGISNE